MLRKLATVLLVVGWASLASAQWYDTTEVPGGVNDILQPFNFKGYNLQSGGELTGWIAPGTDPKYTGISMLARAGYTFSGTPLYLGLEVPLSYFSSDAMSQFVIGNVGLGVKYRLDPFKKELEFYSGWSLDVYLPTAWLADDEVTQIKQLAAHSVGIANSLFAAMHLPETMAIVASFDIVLPGKVVFFQFELSPAVFIAVSHTDERETAGGLFWGGVAGLHIIQQLALMVEFKAYTPLNQESNDTTCMALSPGLRMRFGPLQPAVWVSIPLNGDYRDVSADAIIGVDISVWF